MTRKTYLFPLMAMTALSLTLGACDDNKTEETAVDQTTVTTADGSTATTTTTTTTETTPAATTVINAEGATSYATAEGVRTGAIFVKLKNPNAEADMLTGASTDKAGTVEVHQSFVDEADGTMQMRRVDSVVIPAGQEVVLDPSGYHIMLIDLVSPLVEGDTFNVTLQFEKAGDVVVPVTVTAPGGASAATPAGTPDDGTVIAPSSTTDAPVVEETPATDSSMTPVTPTEEVPADEPVTDAPVTDEQPAQ